MDDVTATRQLPEVNEADRLRVFREDAEALAELAVKVHERAMGDGENANAAAHTDLRIRERRAAMYGYDSPIRYDMIQVEARKEPSSFDKIEATIMRMVAEGSPAQLVLRQRLNELSPEEALERLGLPAPAEPDGAPEIIPD